MDAQWGNRLHCMAENQLPLPNFLGTAEAYFVCHIVQIFRFLWIRESAKMGSELTFPLQYKKITGDGFWILELCFPLKVAAS